MSLTHRARRRNQVMLALNLVLFILYSIIMIKGTRPFYGWVILFVLGANVLTHTIILRSR
jgi:tryptophan-rich sensory protein